MTDEEARTWIDRFIFDLRLAKPGEEDKAELVRDILEEAFTILPALLNLIPPMDYEMFCIYLWVILMRMADSHPDVTELRLPQTFGRNSEDIWLEFDRLFDDGRLTARENRLLERLMSGN